MKKTDLINKGISIAPSLDPALEEENIGPGRTENKKRLLTISLIAAGVAVVVSIIAKGLVYLIDLFTNIAFYGHFSFLHTTPAANHLGIFVILIPAIGGIFVGLMALYGSKAIRGHGIPEAMEQILTNQSKIKPAITYLKPLSSAIAIGTGGPFGAEGPIIATGGAFGSTVGQVLKISHNERKVLLAAGATAGMAAIFGTPIAAIFLAIELLLFEFSPRSLIPVAIACIVGATGHHLLFGQNPVFPMKELAVPANGALLLYSIMGVIIGLLSVVITKTLYFIEEAFEKIPVHWMWWPTLGGLVVGAIGYFAPRTLGVGYENITDILSGNVPLQIVLSLCILKFISWAIALGSGTSGGTLAPLLTIGGAVGALLGITAQYVFPSAGVAVPVAALIGMAAMFAGSSRALLTSIVFALETTSQSNALLPLLGSCVGSYLVSFILMENTIMTEKIARRGVKTPHSYEPDILEGINVEQVIDDSEIVISEDNSIFEVRNWLKTETEYRPNFFVVAGSDGEYKGIISSSNLFSEHHQQESKVGTLIKRKFTYIKTGASLRAAVEKMATENVDVLPILSGENKTVVGIISYHDIIATYKRGVDNHEMQRPNISLKKSGLRILLRGQQLVSLGKWK